jgi:hypothetical protein
VTVRVEIYPIAIGLYDQLPQLDVDAEVDRVRALLADFDADLARQFVDMVGREPTNPTNHHASKPLPVTRGAGAHAGCPSRALPALPWVP